MTDTPALSHYEDHEGDGTCSRCQREGIRWIAVLTDGTRVGGECAKKVLGHNIPSAKRLNWLAKFRPAEMWTFCGKSYVRWVHVNPEVAQDRLTIDGVLWQVGGVKPDMDAGRWS